MVQILRSSLLLASVLSFTFGLSVVDDDLSHRERIENRRRRLQTTQSSPPNTVVFIIDDMPFLQNYNESAPIGTKLEGDDVEYGDFPTPNINAFRSEAVIFPKSYCGGPKCSPSRFSVLTGRQPARSEWAMTETEDEWKGSDVTVINTKISGDDTVYNLPRVLQDNGYYTGMIGKWHLMPSDDNGYNIGCDALETASNAILYKNCTEIIKESGFDFVDGLFVSNIEENNDFSHNPEWMVSRAQHFIDKAVDDENKPFFLYFGSTLVHGPDGYIETTLTERDYTESPKGTLTGDEIPDDTTMSDRNEIWNNAVTMANERLGVDDATFSVKIQYAKHLWMDEQFGAIIDYLRSKRVYRDTLVILQNDHGMGAKGMLYEQGSRIINFLRYPPLFGSDQVILSDDLVVSNVDLAPTIFDMIGASVPSQYLIDGTSLLDTILDAVDDTQTTDTSCCEHRYIDVKKSRSIVSSQYQYIWRADDDVETANNVDTLYPSTYDEQQLYDLKSDPNQKINLIADYESYRSDDSDGSLSSTITTFQSMMRDYIHSTCPPSDGQCDIPSFSFCTEIVTEDYRFFGIEALNHSVEIGLLEDAEDRIIDDHPNCTVQHYWYSMELNTNWQRVAVDVAVCCGDDGAVFPGDYIAPNGFLWTEPVSIAVSTLNPSVDPTEEPSVYRTVEPSGNPTTDPVSITVSTLSPSMDPTKNPSVYRTVEPSHNPTTELVPFAVSTLSPTMDPTTDPTGGPTKEPTVSTMTAYPTMVPTINPVANTDDDDDGDDDDYDDDGDGDELDPDSDLTVILAKATTKTPVSSSGDEEGVAFQSNEATKPNGIGIKIAIFSAIAVMVCVFVLVMEWNRKKIQAVATEYNQSETMDLESEHIDHHKLCASSSISVREGPEGNGCTV